MLRPTLFRYDADDSNGYVTGGGQLGVHCASEAQVPPFVTLVHLSDKGFDNRRHGGQAESS